MKIDFLNVLYTDKFQSTFDTPLDGYCRRRQQDVCETIVCGWVFKWTTNAKFQTKLRYFKTLLRPTNDCQF